MRAHKLRTPIREGDKPAADWAPTPRFAPSVLRNIGAGTRKKAATVGQDPRQSVRSDSALRATTVVMLLAGGQGQRLYPLTRKRAKPAVPFGGLYRIIDFALSNCLNSGLKRIFVLTQHLSLSLDRHLRNAWSILHPEMGEFVQAVPPQQQGPSQWYAGTADAVFHNIDLLEEEHPERVLMLSGDHIYRMHYDWLLRFHEERDADVTVVCTAVQPADATRMGVVDADVDGRMVGFEEKPAHPHRLAARPDRCLVNTGIYVFRTAALIRSLVADAQTKSEHDFGRNIIPTMLRSQRRVWACNLTQHCAPAWHFWQDVGTLDSYFDANMALLTSTPAFDLYDEGWPIRHESGQYPPAMLRNPLGHEACVENSIVSPGALVSGGTVRNSVLSPRVRVGSRAFVEDSILLPGATIDAGARVRRAIVDENIHIDGPIRIGYDPVIDARRFVITPGGLVIVSEGARHH